MNISLKEAIEIHAQVLKHRLNHKVPSYARQRAAAFKYVGDHEGHAVWLSVAEIAEEAVE